MSSMQTPIRKNDNVVVIAGKDRGKRGRVLRLVPGKNRLIVEGFEIDRRMKTGENTRNPIEIGELAVRNGNALANAGRAKAFALQDRVENGARGKARHFGRFFRDSLKKLLFGTNPQIRDDRFLGDNVAECHALILADNSSCIARIAARFKIVRL